MTGDRIDTSAAEAVLADAVAAPPVLRIVRGDPTDDELAAVVTVLAAAAANSRAAGRRAEPAASTWSAYWRGLRRPMQPGPGAWQRSSWPY